MQLTGLLGGDETRVRVRVRVRVRERELDQANSRIVLGTVRTVCSQTPMLALTDTHAHRRNWDWDRGWD